jgi:invasion protein IalB
MRLAIHRFLYIALCLVAAACSDSKSGQLIELVKRSSDFNRPITQWIPPDESGHVNLWNELKGQTLPHVRGKEWFSARYHVMRFWLEKQHFAEQVDLVWRFSGSERPESYFVFKPELAKHIDASGLKIGRREFVEVTYSNSFEGRSVTGVQVRFHSIVFTYRIVSDLPGWVASTELSTGKAIAYDDPSDGQVKLDTVQLNDAALPVLDPKIAQEAEKDLGGNAEMVFNTPASSSAQFGFEAWLVHCDGIDSRVGCGMSQRILDQGSRRPVLQLHFSRARKGKGHQLVAVLPLGVSVPPGIAIEIAKTKRSIAFTQCFKGGCVAPLAVDEPFIETMKANGEGRVGVVDRAGKTVVISFSLKGFASAFKKLEHQ